MLNTFFQEKLYKGWFSPWLRAWVGRTYLAFCPKSVKICPFHAWCPLKNV